MINVLLYTGHRFAYRSTASATERDNSQRNRMQHNAPRLDLVMCSSAFQGQRTALHCAADQGHAEVATVLLRAGADVAAVNKVVSHHSCG